MFQKVIIIIHMRVTKLAGRPGRGNQSPGSGGAPKFKKNWLPFACSPYDPDHIFPSKWLPTALRGTPLIGFACLAFLINAWEQLYFCTRNYFKLSRTKTDKNYQKNKKNYKEIYIILMRVPILAGRPGRGNQSPGSGGAPKFFKIWLPFACSPYVPDLIFPSKWLPTALRGTPLIGFACLAFLLNAWEQLYFLIAVDQNENEMKIVAKEKKNR